MIEISFNKILLEGAKEEYRIKRKQIVERMEELKDLLIRIKEAGRWTLTTNVMGMENHNPELEKDLDLLTRCGLIKSQVRYTKHNTYREYMVTQRGEVIVKHIRA